MTASQRDADQALAQQSQLAVVQHVQVGLAQAVRRRVQLAGRPELDPQAGREARRLGAASCP